MCLPRRPQPGVGKRSACAPVHRNSSEATRRRVTASVRIKSGRRSPARMLSFSGQLEPRCCNATFPITRTRSTARSLSRQATSTLRPSPWSHSAGQDLPKRAAAQTRARKIRAIAIPDTSRSTGSMASTPKLNDTQLEVPRWVADGAPTDVMEGYGHRISAAALRTRGLIRISGRSTTWRARITPAGEVVLGLNRMTAQPRPPGDAVPGLAEGLSGQRGADAARRSHCRAISGARIRSSRPHETRPSVCAQAGTGCYASARGAASPTRRVSRLLLRRAILILHGLTKEAVRRGWEVVPYPEEDRRGARGIAIKAGDDSYPVELNELTEQLLLTRGDRRLAPPRAPRTRWSPERVSAGASVGRRGRGSTAPRAAQRLPGRSS
jgi:hypothetical protein